MDKLAHLPHVEWVTPILATVKTGEIWRRRQTSLAASDSMLQTLANKDQDWVHDLERPQLTYSFEKWLLISRLLPSRLCSILLGTGRGNFDPPPQGTHGILGENWPKTNKPSACAEFPGWTLPLGLCLWRWRGTCPSPGLVKGEGWEEKTSLRGILEERVLNSVFREE